MAILIHSKSHMQILRIWRRTSQTSIILVTPTIKKKILSRLQIHQARKKKDGVQQESGAVETDPGENLEHLMSETKLGNPCQGIMPPSEENRSKQ